MPGKKRLSDLNKPPSGKKSKSDTLHVSNPLPDLQEVIRGLRPSYLQENPIDLELPTEFPIFLTSVKETNKEEECRMSKILYFLKNGTYTGYSHKCSHELCFSLSNKVKKIYSDNQVPYYKIYNTIG